jgi:excinuclease UvrABC nuclease subunit
MKYFKPYTNNAPTLKKTGAGVYVIKKNNVVVYVGMSYRDVKKTLYRHFQKWTDKRTYFSKQNSIYERVTYHNENLDLFSCRVIFTDSDKQTENLEQYLIKKYSPINNTLKIYYLSKKDEEIVKNIIKKDNFVKEYETNDFKIFEDYQFINLDEETPF